MDPLLHLILLGLLALLILLHRLLLSGLLAPLLSTLRPSDLSDLFRLALLAQQPWMLHLLVRLGLLIRMIPSVRSDRSAPLFRLFPSAPSGQLGYT